MRAIGFRASRSGSGLEAQRRFLASLTILAPLNRSQIRARGLCAPYVGGAPHRWWPVGRASAVCLRCSAYDKGHKWD